MDKLVHCTVCDQDLEPAAFSPSEITKKRTGRCRACTRIRVREKYREYRKDPERRALLHQKAKDYRKTDKGRLAVQRDNRSESHKQIMAAWRKAHPEAVSNARHQRRALVTGSIATGELAALLKAQENLCAYCDVKLLEVGMHLDHVIPLSRGGDHVIENVAYACPECNLSKGSKLLDEWEGPATP